MKKQVEEEGMICWLDPVRLCLVSMLFVVSYYCIVVVDVFTIIDWSVLMNIISEK